MEAFAKRKGLIDHMYFYRIPHWGLNLCDTKNADLLPQGQYLGISHPSLDTEEMRLTGNASISGTLVAETRARETALLSDKAYLDSLGVQSIRYSDASFERRLTVTDMIHIFSGK